MVEIHFGTPGFRSFHDSTPKISRTIEMVNSWRVQGSKVHNFLLDLLLRSNLRLRDFGLQEFPWLQLTILLDYQTPNWKREVTLLPQPTIMINSELRGLSLQMTTTLLNCRMPNWDRRLTLIPQPTTLIKSKLRASGLLALENHHTPELSNVKLRSMTHTHAITNNCD